MAEILPMARWHGGILALLLGCSGCWSIDSADLSAIGKEYGLALTESECDPNDVEPVASLQVAKGGFYLLGLIPVVKVSLGEAIEELAVQAKEAGADGVCDIRYSLSPANPLKFLVFPVPDWSAGVQVFGMAYRDRAARAAAHRGSGDS